ncbi:hypothetical protein jhhlp_005789 [Lomentospora prolificans]|uniref:NmrA-like domain-containing protein n=1 Tax=Lomentospora prolificans TaxID=41688 RepID=A0A2N3N434_9PEZI|nr:hypothetical protein jhhlp_005789 [Lomentospora prolificans]
MTPTQVFVCGATGTQGGATAKHLLAAGVKVHTVTRNPSSEKAKALEALGIKVFPGDYDDIQSLNPALAGCDAIFLNFFPDLKDLTHEARQGKAVIAAAKEAGVKHAAYASFMSHDELPASEVWKEVSLAGPFFEAKDEIFNAMVDAGFDTWTRLQPGKFMGDFIAPGVPMFPDLGVSGIWNSVIRPDDQIRLVNPDDIGIVSAAALLDPEKYNSQKVDIFSDLVTPVQLVEAIAKVSGKKVGIKFYTAEEIKELSNNPFIVAQLLTRYTGADISLETAKKWGSKCQSFEDFLNKNKALVDSTFANVPSA